MQVYILVAVAGVTVILLSLAGIFLLKKKHSDKIKGELTKAKNELVWNGIIQSIYISFAQIMLTSAIQAKMLMRGSRYSDELTYAVVVGAGVYTLGVIVSMTYTLYKYQNELSKTHVKKSFVNLYVGVNYKRKGMRLYYWVYFIIRRVLFFLVPVMLWSMPLLQLQFLCFFTSLYVILIAHIKPHSDHSQKRLEIFNEVMLMMSSYHMFCFTEFCLDDMQKYRMGHSYIFFVSGTFIYNVSKMIIKNVERWKRKKRMENLRNNFLINQHEILRKEHVERLYADKKKSSGNLLAAQFKRQEEQRMIRNMEKAYLQAQSGNKATAALGAMKGNFKLKKSKTVVGNEM